MKFINKNTDSAIICQAKNIKDGILTLTSASITATFKDFAEASTNLFIKKNTTAGGSDEQIEVLDATNGFFSVKVAAVNTVNLSQRNVYCIVTVVIGSVSYSDSFYVKIIENKGMSITSHAQSGATAERPTLTAFDIGFEFFDTDLSSPVWWNGSEWV